MPAFFVTQVKFVKTGAMCIVRVAVEKSICVELFDRVPQVRFLNFLDVRCW